jgi:hypothetical protein
MNWLASMENLCFQDIEGVAQAIVLIEKKELC